MNRTNERPTYEDLREEVARRLRKAAKRGRSGLPLSFAQQRLWFLDQIEPASPAYNMPSVARLTGVLDVSALERSLEAIVTRHESLRTRFISHDGEPAQVIEGCDNFELEQHDLTLIEEPQRETELERRISQEIKRPFDLSAGGLFRATLFRLRAEEHVLVILMHHIVSDEWSFKIFFHELADLYQSFAEDRPVSLPELPIQYSDYAIWQRDWLKDGRLDEHLHFWKEQLSGNPAATELPADRPRRAGSDSPGAGEWRIMDKELAVAIKALAQRENATLFMVLLAAFKVLLFRYTGEKDLVIGTPMAGRTRLETENLIGFFINTLPLRTRPDGGMGFTEFLAQVRDLALNVFSHQDLPFEKLVEALHPERSLNHTPFVRNIFFVQSVTGTPLNLPRLKTEFLNSGNGMAKFDLTLQVFDTPNGLIAGTEYNARLFEAETIARLLEHFENLLQGIVRQPAQRLSELPLLSEAEKCKVLVEWNDTRTDYPRSRCIHELFEEQARERHDGISVVFGEDSLTYGELNRQANQTAHHLRRAGVEAGGMVAICVERSLEMIVGLLGILKAGAAYAAIDASAPPQRLRQLLGALRPAALLTQRRSAESLSAVVREFDSSTSAPKVICLDSERRDIAAESDENLCCEIGPEELAYVSFTSGSTGQPKGVCVPHRAVARLVRNTNYANFSAEEVFLHLAPLPFDASTFEIWGPLLNGGRVIVGPAHIPSLAELAEIIRKYGVTTAWFTTGLFNQIVDGDVTVLNPLRQILTGGDVLSPAHVKKALAALEGVRLINGYGPTENTTFTTCYSLPPDFSGENAIPIGRPISNTTCYILDEHLQPVPIGVPGELYTGGDGLAAGYLNAPELTAEKFIPNPFDQAVRTVPLDSTLPSGASRLYRTGDLARYRADGTIEFLGRKDRQVKVRGFRVEPAEIEAALLQHPAVRECVVVPQEDAAGTKTLAAYFVRKSPSVGANELQLFLQERLPDYMVPTYFVALEKLPLSRNGKVDRAKLPSVLSLESRPSVSQDAPSPLEQQLRELWEEILKVRPIGVNDQFFALGGHSLLAVKLVALVEKRFGKKLKVADIFENPTVERLAAVLQGNTKSERASSIVEIQPKGSRPPLFLVHGAGGGMFWGYSNLGRHLGLDQPVFAFESRGLRGEEEFDTIEELAEAYLADLRIFQPHGPYLLGGYCFGGVVAYEMSRRLRSQGEEVALLALINSTAPNSSYGQFRWTLLSAFRFARNIFLRGVHSFALHPQKLARFVQWKTQALAKRLRLRRHEPRPASTIETFDPGDLIDLSEFPEEQRRVWHKHLRALIRYHPESYDGHITLFRNPVHLVRCSFDSTYGWGEYAAGGISVKVIPGAHETIMEERGVPALAAEFQKCLAEATKA